MRTLSIFAVALSLFLGASWLAWARAEEPLTRAEAKLLYLEAYTQRRLNPAAAKEKLERVVAGISPDFEYHQKASHLLELLREDRLGDDRQVLARAPRPSSLADPQFVTSLPLPDPPDLLYTGPALTAREAQEKGVQHLQRGQFDLAVSLFWHALELDPEGQSLTHKMMGICYARLGEKCQAARHYHAYVTSNPDASDAPKVWQILRKYVEKAEDSIECTGA